MAVNGRTILYEPTLNASGMTLFGENGFIIGREAFKNNQELTKTLLHELHRLATTASKAEGMLQWTSPPRRRRTPRRSPTISTGSVRS